MKKYTITDKEWEQVLNKVKTLEKNNDYLTGVIEGMEEKIERPKRVLNYESTNLGFLQYVDKLEAYANKLEAKINYENRK